MRLLQKHEDASSSQFWEVVSPRWREHIYHTTIWNIPQYLRNIHFWTLRNTGCWKFPIWLVSSREKELWQMWQNCRFSIKAKAIDIWAPMILIKARNIKSRNEEIEGYKYNLHTQVLLLVTIRVCNCALSGDVFFVFFTFYWWVVKRMGALITGQAWTGRIKTGEWR